MTGLIRYTGVERYRYRVTMQLHTDSRSIQNGRILFGQTLYVQILVKVIFNLIYQLDFFKVVLQCLGSGSPKFLHFQTLYSDFG